MKTIKVASVSVGQSLWYAGKVGETYMVKEYDDKYYQVLDNGYETGKFILKTDCN